MTCHTSIVPAGGAAGLFLWSCFGTPLSDLGLVVLPISNF
jgi:hypothetical protein